MFQYIHFLTLYVPLGYLLNAFKEKLWHEKPGLFGDFARTP